VVRVRGVLRRAGEDLAGLRERLRRIPRSVRIRVYRCLDCGATFLVPKYVVEEYEPPYREYIAYRVDRVRWLVAVCPRCGSRRIVASEEEVGWWE